jgi:alpha-L-fucosidase
VSWRQQADGLHLDLPAQPAGEYAYVFRIELSASAP